ncbi:MAG TPA: tetratricopeptide repeat protein [Longimicrobiales bacterium]|nr:tetratricopeptide repeat protein [Longimicrobiales bacterium]
MTDARTSRRGILLVLGATLLGAPSGAVAQDVDRAAVRGADRSAVDADRASLVERLHRLVAEAEREELAVASRMEADNAPGAEAARDTLMDATRETRERLVALLDTVVLRTEWGGDELARLRRRYPASALFLRYEAELAMRDARFEAAVAVYDRLLAMRPDVAELHARRGAALEGLGRSSPAIVAYTRALEADPRDPEAFPALVRLRHDDGSLPALLAQVRRLRTLYPGLEMLRERETEILHRMGEPLRDTASS